jgi:hypothetical protein
MQLPSPLIFLQITKKEITKIQYMAIDNTERS